MRRGFTLIELTVTLVIVGLAMAVVVPAILPERDRSELDAAVERVTSVLELARDSAVSGATPVSLVIDPGAALFWLSASANPDVAAGATAEPLGLPSGIRLQVDADRAVFLFQPRGSVFPDSLLLMGATQSRLVTMDALTGHVLVRP